MEVGVHARLVELVVQAVPQSHGVALVHDFGGGHQRRGDGGGGVLRAPCRRLGFRITGYGLRVTGYGFRDWGLGLRVTGYGLRV